MTSNNVVITTSGQVKAQIVPPAPNVAEINVTKVYPEVVNGDTINVEVGNFSNSGTLDELYVAGETVEAYKMGYISESGKVFIAGSNIPESRCLVRGMIVDSGNTGTQVRVRPFGTISNSNWTWGTNGNVYLQTNGNVGIVPPSTSGEYIQQVAIIKSSMVLLLDIDQTTIRI